MNTNYLKKWKFFDKILTDNLFEIKYTIDDWNHCYYSEEFNGHIEYNIENDELIVFDILNNIVIELHNTELNEINIFNIISQQPME